MPTATRLPPPLPEQQTPFLNNLGRIEPRWYEWLAGMDRLARELRAEVSNAIDAIATAETDITAIEANITALENPTKLVFDDGIAAPTAIVGKAQIYVDTADGDLKVRFGDNVTKIVAADT